MSSRDEILNRVRRHSPASDGPPPAFTDAILFADPVSQFEEVLTTVGGRCERANSYEEAQQSVRDIVKQTDSSKVCSLVEGIEVSNFDLSEITDPHLLQDVDLAVMPGHLAVAENAAVWVTANSPLERTLYFLAQHLVLVVPHTHIVSNLHQAYDRLDVAATHFGTWISGPSKTADIEQSLVMGAHGPRSLTVMLLTDADVNTDAPADATTHP